MLLRVRYYWLISISLYGILAAILSPLACYAAPIEEARVADFSGPTKPPADAFDRFRIATAQAEKALKSLPELQANLTQVDVRLEEGFEGTRFNFWTFLLLGAAAAVTAEKLVRMLLSRLVRLPVASQPAGDVTLMAAIDLAAVGVLWITLYGFATWSNVPNVLQERVDDIIFTNVFLWRLAILIPRLWFRPRNAALRIAQVNDDDARRLYFVFSYAVLGYMLCRSFIGVLLVAEVPPESIVLAGFFNNLAYTIIDLSAIFAVRGAMRRWLCTLIDRTSGLVSIKTWLAEYWWVIGIVADVVMTVAHAYGILTGNHNVGSGLVSSVALVLLLLFLEALFDYIQRPADAEVAEGSRRAHFADLVARCLRFVARLVIFVELTELWLFDILHLPFTDKQAEIAGSGARDAVLFISIAYILWQVACHLIARKLTPALLDVEGAQGSRLKTMLPLARVALGVTIAVLTVLTVLSRLGVDIAPLIAGASVLGLAISFGSQTLVRDIVSGIFFLADDAFRIGEYIDAGRVKGTVEGFTLRSMKLRHQNGPLHTVPFGQLGSITNYSREWITLKFNLRVARDSDLEFVRKTTKKIGAEMMSDAELAPLILEPLKLQGVADILDTALLLRFKVTVKPGNPTHIQRQAIKRIITRFGELGIRFPSPTVTVRSASDGDLAGAAVFAAAQRHAPPA